MSAWAWPQWTYAFLMALSFVFVCMLNGTPREPWDWKIAALNSALAIWLTWAGGFWS